MQYTIGKSFRLYNLLTGMAYYLDGFCPDPDDWQTFTEDEPFVPALEQSCVTLDYQGRSGEYEGYASSEFEDEPQLLQVLAEFRSALSSRGWLLNPQIHIRKAYEPQ